MSGLERSLYKLNAVRELGEWASDFIDMDAIEEDDGNDGNGSFITQNKTQSIGATVPESLVVHDVETDGILSVEDDKEDDAVPTFFAQPCVTPVPNSESALGKKRSDSVIVIIRHGKTQVRNRKSVWLAIHVGSSSKSFICSRITLFYFVLFSFRLLSPLWLVVLGVYSTINLVCSQVRHGDGICETVFPLFSVYYLSLTLLFDFILQVGKMHRWPMRESKKPCSRVETSRSMDSSTLLVVSIVDSHLLVRFNV